LLDMLAEAKHPPTSSSALFLEPPPKPAEPTQPAPERKERAKRALRSPLLFFMPVGEWLSGREIAKRSGRGANSVAVALTSFKKSGIVEHDKKRQLWRKHVKAVMDVSVKS
jgi:hypothetical protein